MALELRMKPVYLMGHFHALWHAALEQQEDGDLTVWTDQFISDSAEFTGDAPQFVSLLQKHGWLDGRLLHDWIDYAGRYLESKYRTSNPARLSEIWGKHGKVWLQSDSRQTKDSPDKKDERREEKRTLAPGGAKASEVSPRWPIESIREVVLGWKVQSGNRPDDKSWDRVHFGKNAKYAAELLELFGGDVGACLDCIQERWEFIKDKKGLDLSLAGVVKGSDIFRQKWLERKEFRATGAR